jgi:tRNA threonylcarbamoyladenosine biosynthesis protein TsaB
MLILGVDTSGKNGSLALVRFENGAPQTLDVVDLSGGAFSAQLIPQLSAMLAQHGLSKHAIDGFAVTSGPGSFTGLRVGLAAFKALAEVLQKPIAAVSMLEALVSSPELDTRNGDRVIAVLDAGRGEIYSGIFDCSDHQAIGAGQKLVTLDELTANAAGTQVATSDSKLCELLRAAKLKVTLVPRPTADAIARLGFEKIQAGEVVSPEDLDALYIRRSDAEIKFAK